MEKRLTTKTVALPAGGAKGVLLRFPEDWAGARPRFALPLRCLPFVSYLSIVILGLDPRIHPRMQGVP